MNTPTTVLAAGLSSAFIIHSANAGAVTTLTIDPAQSSLTMDVTLDVGTSSTSSDSSTLSGQIVLGGTEQHLSESWLPLADLLIHIDDELSFNWSFGFLGGANATMSDPFSDGAGNLLKDPATDPVGTDVAGDGSFNLPAVPVVLEGIVDASYNVLFVGSGSTSVDLTALGPASSDMPGTFLIAGDQGTITATIEFAGTQPLVDDSGTELGTITFEGQATIVATGAINLCPPDFTDDGNLDIFDVFGFLDAYSTHDPSADFTGDTIFDVFDVFSFLDAYANGCP